MNKRRLDNIFFLTWLLYGLFLRKLEVFMKNRLILLFLVGLLVFVGCEKQRPMEEYLDLIQQSRDEGDTQALLRNYQLLLRYYPDAERIDNHRQNYINAIFSALENKEISGTHHLQEIQQKAELLENDTTKIWISYRLYSSYTEMGEIDRANALLEDLDYDGYMIIAQRLLANQRHEESISVFKKILDIFPDHDDLYKVHFLIAFTYSENLKDYEKAKVYFQNVADKYPESDLADDALWMIDNMEKSPDEITFVTD